MVFGAVNAIVLKGDALEVRVCTKARPAPAGVFPPDPVLALPSANSTRIDISPPLAGSAFQSRF